MIQQLKKQKTLAFLISFCILMCIHCQKDTPIIVSKIKLFDSDYKFFHDTTGTTKVINGNKYTIEKVMLFKNDGIFVSLSNYYCEGIEEILAHELFEDTLSMRSNGIEKQNHFEVLDKVFVFNNDTLNITSSHKNWILCETKQTPARWLLFESDWLP